MLQVTSNSNTMSKGEEVEIKALKFSLAITLAQWWRVDYLRLAIHRSLAIHGSRDRWGYHSEVMIYRSNHNIMILDTKT